jgi:putative intracellular protease/amidase
MTGGPLREWLATADATSTCTASVCTGALILRAAKIAGDEAARAAQLAIEYDPHQPWAGLAMLRLRPNTRSAADPGVRQGLPVAPLASALRRA